MQLRQHGPTALVHFTGCPIECDPRLEPTDGAQVMAPRSALRHVVLKRRPQRGRRRQHVLEAGRHDADDHVLVVRGEPARFLERDRVSDDAAVAAEAPAPQAVAEDHHVRAAEAIIRGLEVPSHGRRAAQHVEIARADPLRIERFGLARACHDG